LIYTYYEFQGYCSTGRGCICHYGYSGVNCEVQNLSKTHKTSFGATQKTNFPDANKELKTKTTSTTTISSTTIISTSTLATREAITHSKSILSSLIKTKEIITLDCKNGGLLIDNTCICLNSYTGVECEIAPIYLEQTNQEDNLFKYDTSNIEPNTFTKQHLASAVNQQSSLETQSNDFAIISFNRRGRGGNAENITIQRNLVWPWFGRILFCLNIL
jgi:hypothetical protein